jgi:RNA polymerase sigma-70 factor (ECF subfamily)
MQTDEQLISEYLAGNEQALRSLIGRYLKPIYNFVYRYTASVDDAGDITQDVFVNAWRNIRKFDRSRKFKPWIFTIAKNSALNWLKRKRPASFSEFEDEKGENLLTNFIEDTSPLPDELFARADLARKLSVVLGKLKPDYRLVLLLHYQNNFTFREISELLGEPLDTVKSKHRRALVMLRRLLTS